MTAARDYVAPGPHPVRRPKHVGPTRWHPWARGAMPQSSRVADKGTLDARRRGGLDEDAALADRIAADERGGEPDPPINLETLSRLACIRRRELTEDTD